MHSEEQGGPRETVINAIDGFLVNSVWEMSEKMEWLAKNPEKCAIMGKAGRKKVEKEFTWEKFLKRFEEKAKELVEKKA